MFTGLWHRHCAVGFIAVAYNLEVACCFILRWVVVREVAVEKLAQREFEEIASRQEALQKIFPSLLDIFYQPIFDFSEENRLFQQPPLFSTVLRNLLIS